MMGWGRILAACSVCLGLVTFLSRLPGGPMSLVFLRILIVIHHGMRTQSGQQRAQETLVFQSQTQGSTTPFWGPQGCFYES